MCCFGFLLFSCSVKKNDTIADYAFPFTFENNRIILLATVDGSFGKFLFDTGAEGIITSTPIKTLDKTTGPYERYYLLGSVKKYDAYSINQLQINFTQFPVSTFVLQSDVKMVGLDGILGLSVFKGYYVEISFSDKQIRLYKTKPTGYSKKVSIYFDNQSKPYLQVNIDGINTPFLIDTGSPGDIIFPLPVANCIDRKKYQKILSLNDDYESYRVNIKYYDDGFRVYKNITGNSNPLNPLSTLDLGFLFSQNGNIGIHYLKKFDFLIDNRGYPIANINYRERFLIANLYPGRRGFWYINGRANAQYNAFGIDGWKIVDNKLYISSVIEHGQAINAGIQPGTEIKRINGKETSKYSNRKLEDLFLINKNKLELLCYINNSDQLIILK